MESFTPLTAALGGTLIGLAAAVLWLGNGRIAGISGIFGQLLPPAQTVVWRIVFLVALVASAFAAARLFPGLGAGGELPARLVEAPAAWGIPTPVWIGIAGLLTGLGTKIGNGCTSGHGVCGLARLSPRSLVATLVFFGVAVITVTVTGGGVMSAIRLPYLATAALSGLLFGAGLYVSQMVDPFKVLRFLDFTAIPTGGWDPSLAFVMGAALVVMFIAVQIGKRRGSPLFDTTFHEPEYKRIDRRLIGGAALFGIGWGMAGICPGPAISLIAFLPDNLWIFLVTMFAGSLAGSIIVPSGHARRVADAQ